ncbi:glycosyltransferase family 2 protein [Trujillonella endophytica]|uniref:Glycosyl transferase family 2 n=1 Tax=Trujillonella endophytica TaxID=673521 RepID=A0A1H8VSD8_9ACTN|nr:glycosyltransferase family 2 protein [Trujillella endophytica]SEP18210.1 Glycosyl transferase family 2 [Trujillella endophytica]
MLSGPEPVVAVVVRTRDRPLMLERALADVCAQTFPDWELVVVDDGGDAAVVDDLVAARPGLAGRVTVLHNAESRGMEAASNQGIGASASEFVAIHDDDDTWHPEFLARTVAHLRETGDAGVAVRTEIVWERVRDGRLEEESREVFAPEARSFSLAQLLRSNRVVPISLLYRRSVHDEVGPFREDLPVVGDWEFNLRLAQSQCPIGFLDGEVLAFWHQRPEADGALVNSVFARARDHRAADLRVREEALRAHVRRHGVGGLLYLTGYLRTEIDHLHNLFRESALRQEELLAGQVQAREAQAELGRRTEDLVRRLEERLAGLEAATSDASLVSLLRRRYRRGKARVQAAAGRRRRPGRPAG